MLFIVLNWLTKYDGLMAYFELVIKKKSILGQKIVSGPQKKKSLVHCANHWQSAEKALPLENLGTRLHTPALI